MHEQIGAIFARTAAELNALMESQVVDRVRVREQEAMEAKAEADRAMQDYRHELKRLVRLLKLGHEVEEAMKEDAANPEYSSPDDDDLVVLLEGDEYDEPTKKPTRKRGKRAAPAKSTQQRIEEAARRSNSNPPWNPNKSVLDAFAINTKPPPPQ